MTPSPDHCLCLKASQLSTVCKHLEVTPGVMPVRYRTLKVETLASYHSTWACSSLPQNPVSQLYDSPNMAVLRFHKPPPIQAPHAEFLILHSSIRRDLCYQVFGTMSSVLSKGIHSPFAGCMVVTLQVMHMLQ